MEIYKSYAEVMRELHLTVFDSKLPDLCRYEKEITHANVIFPLHPAASSSQAIGRKRSEGTGGGTYCQT